MTAVDLDAVRSAATVAESSAARAGVHVRRLEGLDEIRATTQLFADVWEASPDTLMPVGVLRALHHANNYTVGAFRDGELVAAGVGFLSDVDPVGDRHLHSHIVGVRPGEQGRAVGYAVKQDQRAWALGRGIDEIQWTFDPLVRRNGWFNLVKLGCVIGDYYTDFYGPMDDGINAGDASDRALVQWRLQSGSTLLAMAGAGPPPVAASSVRGCVVVHEDEDGAPVSEPARGEVRLCQVPLDIVNLRLSAPDVARAWRSAVRDAFVDAFAAGLVATGITKDGFYVLSAPED